MSEETRERSTTSAGLWPEAVLSDLANDNRWVYFMKGTSSGSASSADHVLLKNERFIFVGCYGGSTTLLNSDYYLQ